MFSCCVSANNVISTSLHYTDAGTCICVMSLKCLSIGTPKTIYFPFVSNEKLMIFRCSNIQTHYNEAVIYLNFGTPKSDEFSIFLGVPILKHIRIMMLI